jgi:DNA-binding transcriptional LysR family regulator
MDLRQMRQFVAVAEELHFGKAALRLNMAQPPLSQAIRRLELELGVELFDRSKRAVELTEAGRVFLSAARRTLMQAELARKMTQRAATGVLDVRVGFVGPALHGALPGVLVIHRGAYPEIDVHLLERTTADQIRGILAGDLDVGFVSGFTRHIAGLATQVVERAAYVVAVPANWELAQGNSIRLADLADKPFILPPQAYAGFYSDPLAMLESAGIKPQVTQEAAQTATMLSLVGAGLGCSIMASGVARTRPVNVRFLKIEDAPPHRPWELMAIWSAEGASKPTLGFVEAVRAYVAANPQLIDLSEGGLS